MEVLGRRESQRNIVIVKRGDVGIPTGEPRGNVLCRLLFSQLLGIPQEAGLCVGGVEGRCERGGTERVRMSCEGVVRTW